MELHQLSIKELQKALQARTLSSVELTQYFIDRIQQHNPTLNAYISQSTEKALQTAKQADQQLANNQPTGALTGIPITLKDIYTVDGEQTTCASKMLANFIAPYDATVTSKVKNSLMPILGKANMDEFAMGSTTQNSAFGNTLNPHDHNAIPGGSSGGSAAAVAARLSPFAVGTDTGGSIRQPAACCGVTGIKPTYGVVSRWGQIAFASSLDQGGPIAHSAEECALLLDTISGFDEKDSTSLNQPNTSTQSIIGTEITNKKIGIPYHLFEKTLDDKALANFQETVKTYQQLGFEFIDIQLNTSKLAVAAYYILSSAEASSNLSRYDGVRYGYRCQEPKDLMDLYIRSRSEGFGKEVKRRLMIGTYALSSGYYDAYYAKAQKVRRLITEEFKSIFKNVGAVALPTMLNVAFDLNQHMDDPVAMYIEDSFTVPINLAGLPALSHPSGFNQQNRPYGFQLIGNYNQEGHILNIAHHFQCETNWHLQTPSQYQ